MTKVLTTKDVRDIMSSSWGTEHYYRVLPNLGLFYTDGVKNFAIKCNAYWFVGVVNSYMGEIRKANDSFFWATLTVKDNKAIFKLFREDMETEENVPMVEQTIPFTDLPDCDIKFFIEQADELHYVLMLPSEH